MTQSCAEGTIARIAERRQGTSPICQFRHLRRTTGLRNTLGSPSEKAFQAAPEVKQCSGKDRANTLKDKQPRAWIDISVRLTLKSEAECNKKHQRDGEVSQMIGHSYSLGRIVCMDDPALSEDATVEEKFRLQLLFGVFLLSLRCL